MTGTKSHSVLIVLRTAPYGSGLARAAIDTALAAGAFDQPVAVLLQGRGVLNLMPGQDGSALGRPTLSRVIDSMPLYGIETVHVDEAAAVQFGLPLNELPGYARPCTPAELRELLESHDHLLGF